MVLHIAHCHLSLLLMHMSAPPFLLGGCGLAPSRPPPQVTSGSVPPPLRAGRGCHSTFPSDAPLHTGPDWTLVSGQLCRPRQGQSSCYRQSAAASRTGRPAGHPAQGSPAHTEAAEAHRNGIGARQPFI